MPKRNGLIIFLFFLPAAVLAFQESYQSMNVRANVNQAFWLIEPGNVQGIVLLFAGGGGDIKVTRQGIGRKGNFLVRSRKLFAEQGFVTAVMDKPSDRSAMHYFRTTEQHAQDIKRTIHFLRERHPGKPVWLVGTSRGTLSSANAAARLNGKEGPDGIVLTATVTQTSNDGDDSVNNVDLEKIRVPVLIVHHKDDGCYVTPFKAAKSLPEKLPSAPIKEFVEFAGGKNDGEPCNSKGHHGFSGIEADVTKSITQWIKQHEL